MEHKKIIKTNQNPNHRLFYTKVFPASKKWWHQLTRNTNQRKPTLINISESSRNVWQILFFVMAIKLSSANPFPISDSSVPNVDFSYISPSSLTLPNQTLWLGFLPAMLLGGGGKRSAGALTTAIEDVNQRKEFVRNGIKLGFCYYDAKGNSLAALKAMTELYMKGVSAFIGPEGTCNYEAALATAWNIPLISYKCSEEVQMKQNHLLTFARTQPSTSKVSESIIALLQHYQWFQFVIVVGSRPIWQETADALTKLAAKNNFTVRDVVHFDEPYISGGGVRKIVMETYENTHSDHHALTEFVRTLKSMGLTDSGDYVTIGVNDQPDDPTKRIKYFIFEPFETKESLTMNEIKAFQSVLIMAPRGPSNPNWDSFLERTRQNLGREPFHVPSLPFKKNPISIHAAYLYDAIQVYSRAILESFLEGRNISDGKLITSKIRSRSFESIQGYSVYIDEDGDAKGNYTVLSLQKDVSKPFHMFLDQVGSFEMTSKESGTPKYRPLRDIWWVKGKKPTGEPECGFDGIKCIAKIDWLVVVVCSVVTTLVFMIGILAVRHYSYEKKLERLLWKINFKDIVFLTSPDDVMELPNKSSLKKSMTRWSFLQPNTNSGATPSNAKPFYKGQQVSVKFIGKKSVELTRAMKRRMQLLKEMQHENINRFIGACVDPPNCCIVRQYCARNLGELLHNKDIRLDNMFISSLVADLIKGMLYIHDSDIICHGNLKPSNCLVDARWVLQITDFGVNTLGEVEECCLESMEDEKYYNRLLYTAPELLRSACRNLNGTQKGDSYSFALILYEIHTRHGPWESTNLPKCELIKQLQHHKVGQAPMRPNTQGLSMDENVVRCMEDCWRENPEERLEFRSIKFRLKLFVQDQKPNIYDHIMGLMEKHAENLEILVAQRTIELEEEKKRSENLLMRMLPRSVAESLKIGSPVIPEQYESVTIYFSDIAGFTSLSALSTPLQVVDLLNDLYTCFDSIIGDYSVYKVETIGDAYMVVSGLPERNGDMHAGEIASMSIHLLSAIKHFKIRHRPHERIKLRIGIHSGSCVAGVVGHRMPRYCLFGDTVNTASRMESTGVALKIHCSEKTFLLLQKLGGYHCKPRGHIDIKGKGQMYTYFLVGEDQRYRLRRLNECVKEPLNGITLTKSCSSSKLIRMLSEQNDANMDFLDDNDDVFFTYGQDADDSENLNLLPSLTKFTGRSVSSSSSSSQSGKPLIHYQLPSEH
ncbi:guanylate cyclase 32E-like isoform X2 [Octopus sinensis]|uniref:Guanylate cyclase n=1 Tax=Octopus sinensis TaxID=2607531 RepID=A0A7E6FLK6_9MOLL|nr:guanylate cyclase 32E-like isoform X2 [Octopus sinensis]